jgi:NAD(P)-dependent dehydrogenase (short-subunit alcohol dehydrogenase family)
VFDGKTVPYLLAIQRAKVTGSITLVSGASARGNAPGTSALAAANGAIVRAVPPLAAELAPVRVNAVSPGVINTPWWSFLDEQQRRAQFEEFSSSLPAGRVGRPEDVADAISYLIAASYVTGAVLPVDGGLTVG